MLCSVFQYNNLDTYKKQKIQYKANNVFNDIMYDVSFNNSLWIISTHSVQGEKEENGKKKKEYSMKLRETV